MRIGTIVELQIHCLGNPPGSIGVVFYDYGNGFQVIFENGNYDGFSTERKMMLDNISQTEAEFFLKEIGFEPLLAKYEFKNVMQVSDDFIRRVFDCVFKKRNSNE